MCIQSSKIRSADEAGHKTLKKLPVSNNFACTYAVMYVFTCS